MAYGDLLSQMHNKKIVLFNGSAKGYNPYTEASFLRRLLATRPHLKAFDFKKWDTSVSAQLLHRVFDTMDALYPADDGTEIWKQGFLLRNWVRNANCNSIHLIDGTFVEWWGSISSGSGITGEMGDEANKMLCAIACARYWLEQKDPRKAYVEPLVLVHYKHGDFDFNAFFEDNVLITQGDDVIMSLSAEYANMSSCDFATALRYFGVRITNYDKTDPIERPIVNLDWDQATFLKRNFKTINGQDVAPLEIESIYKSFYYFHKSMKVEDIEQVLNTVALELSLHGKETFDKHISQLEFLSMEAYGVLLRYTNWKTAFNTVSKLELCY